MNEFNTFADLDLPEGLKASLEKMQFLAPTPVQKAAIPEALSGKDILGTAQTGTGKTGAFGIPMLARLHKDPSKQALILAPTRELAAQIHGVLRQMSQGLKLKSSLVVGGESFRRQADELRRGVDFIVATPGRLNDHLDARTTTLQKVGCLVLDEVDRMLDMGFAPQISEVISYLRGPRQTLLFSATLPREIMQLVDQLLKDPVRVSIEMTQEQSLNVTQTTIKTTNEAKAGLVLEQVAQHQEKVLIFTRTQSRTDRLAKVLYERGHAVVRLHGGRTQAQRKEALEKFRSGTHRVMVATDLAGRGIDVIDIAHVINYDLPMNREDYVHRIGRTGRYGRTGTAVTFLCPADGHAGHILNERKRFTPQASTARSQKFAAKRPQPERPIKASRQIVIDVPRPVETPPELGVFEGKPPHEGSKAAFEKSGRQFGKPRHSETFDILAAGETPPVEVDEDQRPQRRSFRGKNPRFNRGPGGRPDPRPQFARRFEGGDSRPVRTEGGPPHRGGFRPGGGERPSRPPFQRGGFKQPRENFSGAGEGRTPRFQSAEGGPRGPRPAFRSGPPRFARPEGGAFRSESRPGGSRPSFRGNRPQAGGRPPFKRPPVYDRPVQFDNFEEFVKHEETRLKQEPGAGKPRPQQFRSGPPQMGGRPEGSGFRAGGGRPSRPPFKRSGKPHRRSGSV